MRCISPLSLLLLSLSATWLPAESRAASFLGLGFVPGGTDSVANAVSADGSVVVGQSGLNAFRRTAATGMVDIGGDGATDVAADGSVVVGYTGLAVEAFRWTEETGIIGLGIPSGWIESVARGVSADGSVVVGAGTHRPGPVLGEAFRWTATGGMTGLGLLPGDLGSDAYDVSADGSVVVGFSQDLSRTRAFLWTAGSGMIDLLPSSPYSISYGVSADGSVVVGHDDGEPFRWTASGGETLLGLVPGFDHGSALSVSGDGSIIVGINQVNGEFDASPFIWDAAHGSRLLTQVLTGDYGLDLTGWRLDTATAVSSDGRAIVGYGRNPSGAIEAWIAVIPEPGTGLLVMTGVVGIAASRRRRRTS